tara:strand:- start:1082 stop:1882 length:801 start_codon:yes stop_codon:yes gene_type:complete
LFNIFIAVVSIGYIVRLVKQQTSLDNFQFKPDLIEIILTLLIYATFGSMWVRFSNDDNNKGIGVFANWALSNLGKYSPAGIGLITIRLNQNEKNGNSKKVIFGLLEEQFLLPLVALPGLVIGMKVVDNAYFVVLYALTQIAVVIIFRKFYFINNKIKKVSLLNQQKLVILIILLTQLLISLIFYNFQVEDYLLLALYYTISSNIALFFVGVPAGIGIRETIFIFLTTSQITFIDQLEIVIHIRLLFISAEIFFGFLGIVLKSRINN